MSDLDDLTELGVSLLPVSHRGRPWVDPLLRSVAAMILRAIEVSDFSRDAGIGSRVPSLKDPPADILHERVTQGVCYYCGRRDAHDGTCPNFV